MATRITGELTTERLTNTRNGNARYEVSILMDYGCIVTGRTKGDSMFVINMPTSGQVEAWFKSDQFGSFTFTDIEALKATA